MSTLSVSSSSGSVDFVRNATILYDMANSPDGPMPRANYWTFEGTTEDETDHEMEELMASLDTPSEQQNLFQEPLPYDDHFPRKKEQVQEQLTVEEEQFVEEDDQEEFVAEDQVDADVLDLKPEVEAQLHPIEIMLLRRKAEFLAKQTLQAVKTRSIFGTIWDLFFDSIIMTSYFVMAIAFVLPILAICLALTFDTRYIQNFLEDWGWDSTAFWFTEYYAYIHSIIVTSLRVGASSHDWIPIFQYKEPEAWYVEAKNNVVGIWKYMYGWI